MPTFPEETISAVLAHMNSDHNDDNLLIARAFGDPDASSATMITLDESGGTWLFDTPRRQEQLVVPWRTTITERAQIRQEIVHLYDVACTKLGLEPRPHA